MGLLQSESKRTILDDVFKFDGTNLILLTFRFSEMFLTFISSVALFSFLLNSEVNFRVEVV